MATSLKAFEAIQIGREATKGTAVNATRVLVGNGILREMQERYYSAYPRGVLATVGGDGIVIAKGTEFEIESELCTQEAVWPFLLGARGQVTPTTGTDDETWVFTPADLTDGDPTLDSATVEFVEADGSTNHIQTEAQHVMCSEFEAQFAFNQIATMRWRGFGRARQSATPTAALSPYSSRELLTSNLLSVFLDTSWANLGNTQLATVVRNARLAVQFFPMPDYTLDGRSDLDLTQHRIRPTGARLSLTLELNAAGAARFAAWRAGTRQFVRLKCTGNAVGGAVHTFQFDGSYRIVSQSDPQEAEDGLITQDFELEAVYDETGTNIWAATVINNIDETEL